MNGWILLFAFIYTAIGVRICKAVFTRKPSLGDYSGAGFIWFIFILTYPLWFIVAFIDSYIKGEL